MRASPVALLGQVVELLAAVADRTGTDSPVTGSWTGAADQVRLLVQVQARVDGLLAAAVATLDASGDCVGDGSPTTAAWLRAATRLGRRDASALVHHARSLRELPATAQALRSGSISRAHAAQIVKARTRSDLDVEQFGPFEAILVELACTASPDEVGAAARHLVETQAPDRDGALVEALAGRSFTLRRVGDLVKLDAMVDPVTAEALAAAVESLARPSTDDPRSWHVRRADAFSELVMLGVESGRLPQHGRVRPHVNVTMTLGQLRGIAGTGPVLARFGQIPVATAQRLTCDATLTRLITDPHGDVLDVGRTSRLTTTAQNKAITVMHTTCAYPNCDTTVTGCDIHHIQWWSKGGRTDQTNLIPLCKQHHRFVHEHGYQIQTRHDPTGKPLPGPRRWTFVAPNGTTIRDHRHALAHYTQALHSPPAQLPLPDTG